MAKLELGMISSTWPGTQVGVEEGISRPRRSASTPTTSSRTRSTWTTRARRHQALVRRGRPADPLAALRCVRPRRLQPRGAAFTLDRIKQKSTRALSSAPATCCSWSASTSGTARSSRARRSGTWPSTWCAAVGRVRRDEGPRDRARARAVQRGPAQGRPRAGALRQGGRTRPSSRQRRYLPPPSGGRVVRRRRGDEGPDRPHPSLRLRRQGARRHACRDGRDAHQGVPAGDRRHGLRGHGLDRARVRAGRHRHHPLGAAGLRRHRRDHARSRGAP